MGARELRMRAFDQKLFLESIATSIFPCSVGAPKPKRGRPVKLVPMTFTQYAKAQQLGPVSRAAAREAWYASRRAERLRGGYDD